MPTITKTRVAVTILAVAVALSAIFSAYLIRSDAGGEVLWNAKEAYFFIGMDTSGYHVKWIGYPLEYGLAKLGYVEPPNDDRRSLFVLHVTSSGAERHVFDLPDRSVGSGAGQYTPRGGRIWANCPTLGGLCWWASDHFQLASPEEQRALNGIAGLSKKDFDAGWHWDGVAAASLSQRNIAIGVGQEFELLVSGGRSPDGRGGISVDMQYPGRAPTRVFNLDVRVGRVSKTEYLQAFR